MKLRVIGDVHGYWNRYRDVIYRDMVDQNIENSIQVGDLGMGFTSHSEWAPDSAAAFDKRFSKGNHRFIRGNHDNPTEVKKSKHYIPDGFTETTDLGNKIMYIGGAWSIDWEYRTMDVDWWVDEELSIQELNFFIEEYKDLKPDVMITHTAPLGIPAGPMGIRLWGSGARTEHAFQEMIEIHRPKLWIFGHWHKNFDQTIDGTRFICLNELDYIDLEI
jgi:predicted phosphodiesterase